MIKYTKMPKIQVCVNLTSSRPYTESNGVAFLFARSSESTMLALWEFGQQPQ